MKWGPDRSVQVNMASQDALLAAVAERIEAKKTFSIATLNLDHVIKLRQDPAFLRAYNAQTHVTADGNPIVWLCHLSGQRDISLVPGSELIEPLAEFAAAHNIKVALLGATETSLQMAAKALQERFSGLEITAQIAPSMGFDPDGDEATAALDQLKKSGARIVFLALGAPKQEIFAARAQNVLPDAGFLSIGAGLDFISGAQQRAPLWVRKLAAEWIWRMLKNPRRLAKRYGNCLIAMPGLTVMALRERYKNF